MQKRVTVSLEHEDGSIRQILDAGNCLDGDNLPWFDRYALGRAHLAVSGAVSPLDRSTDLARGIERDPAWHPKTRASDRIRDPGNAALACVARRHSLADEDVDLVSRCRARQRNLCRERRISSIVCAITDRIAERCDDRHLRRSYRAGDVLDAGAKKATENLIRKPRKQEMACEAVASNLLYRKARLHFTLAWQPRFFLRQSGGWWA